MSAADELQEYERERPGAVALAVHTSIAAHVEGELLRRLRVRFAPQVDAGAEADLWFGPLVEAWSASGFSLSPAYVPLLQERFVRLDRRAEVANAIIEFHRPTTPAVAMQERINWLALEGGEAARPGIELELRKAVASLADEARADGIARWAAQALTRLPAVALETDAAGVLELAATLRAGASWAFRHGAERGFPRGAQLALPSGALAREPRKLWLRLADGRLEVVPRGAGAEISAPDTHPIILEVSWSEGPQRRAWLLFGEPGRFIELPASIDSVELRTLVGDRYRVRARREGATPRASDDSYALLRQACGRIAWGDAVGTAYLVQPRWLVTAAHVLSDCPLHTRFLVRTDAGNCMAVLHHLDSNVDAAALYVLSGPEVRPLSDGWPITLGLHEPDRWIGGGFYGDTFTFAAGNVVRGNRLPAMSSVPHVSEVAALQRALRERGLDPGATDGVLGPSTREALIAFQRANGLPLGELVDARTWEALGISRLPFPETVLGPSSPRLTSGSPIIAGGDWNGHVRTCIEVPTGTEYSLSHAESIQGDVIPEAHNGRRQLTSFLAVRAREVTELVRVAREQRIAAIVGPPASGRTRTLLLALEQLQHHGFPGVWLDTYYTTVLASPTEHLSKTVCSALGRPLPPGGVGPEQLSWFCREYLQNQHLTIAIDGVVNPDEPWLSPVAGLVSALEKEQTVTLLFGLHHHSDAKLVSSAAALVELGDLDDSQIAALVHQNGHRAKLLSDASKRAMLGRSPHLWSAALSALARGVPDEELFDPTTDAFQQTFGTHLDWLWRWLELHPDAKLAFESIALRDPSVARGPLLDDLQRIGLLNNQSRIRAGLYLQLVPEDRATVSTARWSAPPLETPQINGPWKHSVAGHGYLLEVELRRASAPWYLLKAWVSSSESNTPLRGLVRFMLYKASREQRARNGVAVFVAKVYGPAVLRAEIGKLTMKLDLAEVPGVPPEFLEGVPPRRRQRRRQKGKKQLK